MSIPRHRLDATAAYSSTARVLAACLALAMVAAAGLWIVA